MWMEALELLLMLEQLYTDLVFGVNKSVIFCRQSNNEVHLPTERKELKSGTIYEWSLKAARIKVNVIPIFRQHLRVILMSPLKHY